MPPRKKIGRPRTTDLRHVMDAVMYMASTGCQWAMLPNDFPLHGGYFYDWRSNGLLGPHQPSLPVGVIDSQSGGMGRGTPIKLRHRTRLLVGLIARRMTRRRARG